MKRNCLIKVLTFVVTIVVLSNFVWSQNIGQKGDSLRNYTDINGNKQGYWEKKYKNGNTAYQATFKNNKLIGTYKRFYENGQMFALIQYPENPDSLASVTYFWDDGKLLAKGHFIEQKLKDGLWEFYNAKETKIAEINYRRGKLDGKKEVYYYNGKLSYKVTYKNGKKNGVEVRYYDNGEKETEQQVVNDKFEGKIYVYYPSGKFKIMGSYKNNLKDGKWTFYSSAGKIEHTIIYHHGIAENQDELDAEFTKQVEEWEKQKGKIKEPSEEMFFKKNTKQQDWENSQ
ncbi:MAG: toxin-antitoxin system YwqK family antitoxin [Bacteroidales bacterium]|nr:toxin-antitoxin system YwqK family antitoxin [Bacteroidales bacterium]